ncbi:MAG: aminotransferase class V-fold PLP-dependent enzyme [Phycisphaeraceae bacterium]|nr:MAG: aminotransferase class V-fold PLP-dependent enzyme [Phycisphaeraceae bacterium]
MLSNPLQGHELPNSPLPSPLAVHWQHDPSVCFLNHGSFGACPTRVLQAQVRYRNRMEAEPIRFFVEDSWDLLDRARAALATFVGAHATDLVPIPNATIAVATVLHHLARTGFLGAGDEVLANDHEYPACLNNLRAVCAMVGAAPVIAPIPFPIRSADQAFDAIMSRVTPRTKAALISHVTSSSGLILPVERLVAALEARGVRTIIDGAHAIGMLPDLNLNTLNASYYTSNCHKWLCTPKGCAFLWIRGDLQHNFRPLVLSNFAEKPKPGRPPLHTEFDFVGTNDITPFLTIPDAIEFLSTLISGGIPALQSHNRAMTLRGRDAICTRLSIQPPAPDDMIGSICTLILPPHDPARRASLSTRPSAYHDALQDSLLSRWRIQVPIWSVADGPRTVRISAHAYNAPGQFEYLAAALEAELARERSSL